MKWKRRVFKKLSIEIKLTVAVLLPVAVVGAVAIYYQMSIINTLESRFGDIIENDIVRLEKLDDMKLYTLEMGDKVQGLQTEDMKAAEAEIQGIGQKIKDAEDDYFEHVETDDGGQGTALVGVDKGIEDLEQKATALYTAITAQPFSESQLRERQAEMRETQGSLLSHIDDALEQAQAQVESENVNAFQTLEDTKRTLWITVTLASLLAVCLSLLVAARMSQSIRRLRTAAHRMANGDFSEAVHLPSRDEIGQLAQTFNQMSVRLKDSYRRLAVEKQRDEAILRDMAEGVIAIDEAGNIVLMNDLSARLLGVSDRAARVGTPVQQVYQLYRQEGKADQLVPPEEQPLLIALKNGMAVSDVFVLHTADGAKRLLNIAAAPVKLDTQIAGAIALVRDVTKEREVDRMKTEFISLASHQLRTPLSAIKWFTEMLMSGDAGELQPDQKEFARNISDSTERMIALVNALLNISRIESGRIMVDPKPTDLKELVTGIVNDLKAKTEEKQQSLVISVHSDLPKINLDPRLIGQVYLNLLTNAIKYTPKSGEISVFISRKGDDIISQVTDSGYGIPKEQQGRIFQKFFRASNAVKVETDGTGLGLYLIKAVVESSGGKIWFESEEGKGTTFWFSIPVTGMRAKEGEVTLDM